MGGVQVVHGGWLESVTDPADLQTRPVVRCVPAPTLRSGRGPGRGWPPGGAR